ncbi:MAG: FAD-dependent oxidoreductase [Epsilonproteobacteria bacterium]|nr:FAD-dependent oxidoreductase [Campylobacterota bacterium]
MAKTIIIGGGIVGLMNAYKLMKKNHQVTVIDKSNITDGASFGNAGLVSPFEEPPLSRPGIISQTLKLMLKGESPLIINGVSKKLLTWLWLFAKNATEQRVEKTLILFEKYGHITMECYEELANEFDFDFHHDGVVMIYTDLEDFEKDIKECENHPHKEAWDFEKTKKVAPCINDKVVGSIYLDRNARLNPKLLMENLVTFLKSKGVEFIYNTRILNFEYKNGKAVKAFSKDRDFEADNFIISTGSDTSLSKKCGNDLMLIPAKGYSITFKMDDSLKPKIALLFKDQFIGFIPRNDSVRLTSKLEIGSYKEGYDAKSFQSIIDTLKPFVVDFKMNEPSYWSGFRPLTPNDIPLFGRDKRYSNIIHANGLGWLGITFAPAVADIVSDLIDKNLKNEQSDDVLLFSGFYQGC